MLYYCQTKRSSFLVLNSFESEERLDVLRGAIFGPFEEDENRYEVASWRGGVFVTFECAAHVSLELLVEGTIEDQVLFGESSAEGS